MYLNLGQDTSNEVLNRNQVDAGRQSIESPG